MAVVAGTEIWSTAVGTGGRDVCGGIVDSGVISSGFFVPRRCDSDFESAHGQGTVLEQGVREVEALGEGEAAILHRHGLRVEVVADILGSPCSSILLEVSEGVLKIVGTAVSVGSADIEICCE